MVYTTSKIKLSNSLYRSIENDVSMLYKEYSINSYPINVKEIVQKMGYELIGTEFGDDLYFLLMKHGTDGLTIELGNRKIIIYKAGESEKRVRFTIAHELGHIRMGHKEESELANMIANHYASYLLAPEILVAASKCSNAEDIEKFFDVSKECSIYKYKSFERWRKLYGLYEYEYKILDIFKMNDTR